MKLLSRNFGLFSLLLASSLLGPVSYQARAAYDPCETVFYDVNLAKYPVYVEAARERAKDVKLPDFFNFKRAIEAAQTWAGRLMPTLLRFALPSGVTLVSHETYMNNEAGLVKSGATVFSTLRTEVDFNGKKIGTNIGVRTQVLEDNLFRSKQSLVSKDAKAVFVFMHGGGTTTTGHHVGIQFMSFLEKYGIDVVAIDNPWHAEGTRELFKDAKEYFEFLRTFARQHLASAGVPLFLGGHSMGGLEADLYMRLFPKDDLFKGVIALSAVPDMAPGGSLLDKLKAYGQIDNIALKDQHRLAEDEMGQGDALLNAGKLTELATVTENLLMHSLDWMIPAHGGKDYIPAFFSWGSGDYLVVGKEHLIRNYIEPLANVTLKIYSERSTIGDVAFAEKKNAELAKKNALTPANTTFPAKRKIGHLIFDHYGAEVKTAEDAQNTNLEAYQDVKSFIEKVMGQELPRVAANSGKPAAHDFLIKFISSYVGNLAFREFMDNAKITTREAPPEIRPIQRIAYEARSLRGKIKGAEKNPAQKAEFQRKYDEMCAEIAAKTGVKDPEEVLNRFAAEWAPAGPEGEYGRGLIAQIEQFKKANKALSATRIQLQRTHDAAQKEANTANAALETAAKRAVWGNRAFHFSRHFSQVNSAQKEMKAALMAARAEIERYYVAWYSKGVRPPEYLPASSEPLLDLYKAKLDKFIELQAQTKEMLRKDAREGNLGPEVRQLLASADAASAKYEQARKELEDAEMQFAKNAIAVNDLQNALVQRYETGPRPLMRVVTVSAANLMQTPFTQFDSVQSGLMMFWTKWKSIYADRPDDSNGPVSLY